MKRVNLAKILDAVLCVSNSQEFITYKKSSNREKSIAALDKQQVSPSRSVAPHYE
jgi:hypothetical protein